MRQLFIKQEVFKITDHYPVLDINDSPVYFVDEEFRILGKTIHVTKPNGQHIFTIKQELFNFMNNFVATFHDGKQIMLKENFKLFKMSIDLISGNHELTLEGDFLDLNFEIFSEGNKVGHIYKKWLSCGDTFTIDVMDPVFEEELLALMLMVDFISDQRQVIAGILTTNG